MATRIKNTLRKINRRKKTVLSIVLFFSSICVISSVYAWFTSYDNKINHFIGTSLSAKIIEEFQETREWEPSTVTTKVVRVKNYGEAPAFVRVSVYEYLLTFQLGLADQTENGNLKKDYIARLPIVFEKHPTSWKNAANSKGTYTYKRNHFFADKPMFADSPDRNYFDQAKRSVTDLNWFHINFSQNVYMAELPKITSDFWYYSDGYFYYSKPIKPGEVSVPLIEGVYLDKYTPNYIKGALYQIEPKMDAHDVSKNVFNTWGMPAYSAVTTHYKKFLK